MSNMLRLVGVAALSLTVHLGLSSPVSASLHSFALQPSDLDLLHQVQTSGSESLRLASQPFNGDGVSEGGPTGTQGSGTR